TIRGGGACGAPQQSVVRRGAAQRDPLPAAGLGRDRRTVQRDLVDRFRGQVDEGLGAGPGAAEDDRGLRREDLVIAGEIEVHAVGADIDQARPFVCLVAGEVACHGGGPFVISSQSVHGLVSSGPGSGPGPLPFLGGNARVGSPVAGKGCPVAYPTLLSQGATWLSRISPR